jgi:hypothetical protein
MIICWQLFSAFFYFLPVHNFLLLEATTASGEDGKTGDRNGNGDFVIARFVVQSTRRDSTLDIVR